MINFLRLHNCPIFQQLQLEEAILRSENSENWCIINQNNPEKAIVMGISGVFNELVNSETFCRSPIPVIRRFSGGGTVVVDHNTLFITFICMKDSPRNFSFPLEI